MRTIEELAACAVESIVDDICDRRGLKWEWHKIDGATQKDIKKTWADIISTTIAHAIVEMNT